MYYKFVYYYPKNEVEIKFCFSLSKYDKTLLKCECICIWSTKSKNQRVGEIVYRKSKRNPSDTLFVYFYFLVDTICFFMP